MGSSGFWSLLPHTEVRGSSQAKQKVKGEGGALCVPVRRSEPGGRCREGCMIGACHSASHSPQQSKCYKTRSYRDGGLKIGNLCMAPVNVQIVACLGHQVTFMGLDTTSLLGSSKCISSSILLSQHPCANFCPTAGFGDNLCNKRL